MNTAAVSNAASCIEACVQAAVACDRCANACLHAADIAALRRCIVLSLDCAQLCKTAHSLLSHGSQFARQICEITAGACDACVAECDAQGSHQHHFTACADACRRAARECRAYAAAHGGRA